MFSWFKKKKKEDEQPTPAPAPSPQPQEPTLPQRVLTILSQRCEGSRLEGDVLYFPDHDLQLRVTFPDLDGLRFRMEATFEHPSFFGPLVESTAGAAPDEEQKAQSAANQLYYSVLEALLPALEGKGTPQPSIQLWERTHLFRASTSGVILQGVEEPPQGQDLWSRMQEFILPCLGSQNVYWVKLYLARIGEDTSCEVRINGWVVPELTQHLVELAQAWPAEGAPLKSAKQYIVLVQDKDTRVNCPYTFEDAKDLTKQAIGLFEEGMEYEVIRDTLSSRAADPSLGEDVFGFLPELVTSTLLTQVQTASQMLIHPDEKEAQTVWFTQCRAWAPVYAAIREHMGKDNPTQEQMMTMVSASAMSQGLSNALSQGSKIEDLVMSRAFLVSNGYILW